MRTIVLSIDKDFILQQVAHEVAYIGAKQSVSEDIYDSLRIVKEDDKELDKFFASALSALFSQLSPYIVDSTPSLDLLIRVPLNFDFFQKETLRGLLGAYFVNEILADWFSLFNKQEETQRFSSTASAQLSLIRSTLNKRQRPIPPLYDKDHKTIHRHYHPEQ